MAFSSGTLRGSNGSDWINNFDLLYFPIVRRIERITVESKGNDASRGAVATQPLCLMQFPFRGLEI